MKTPHWLILVPWGLIAAVLAAFGVAFIPHLPLWALFGMGVLAGVLGARLDDWLRRGL